MRISDPGDGKVMTRVVHVRERFDVYIGRANGRTKGAKDGYFGNPFVIGRDGNRDQVIAKFRDYFLLRLNDDPAYKERVHALIGKTLGCYCKPLACHGDVMVAYLEATVRQK